MDNIKITSDKIESFLQGSNPKQFVVAIEANYNKSTVELVINDQINPKRIESHPFQPFLWLKQEVVETIYGGKRLKILDTAKNFGIKISKLRTWDENNESPDRLLNGYKYIATCSYSYNHLVKFFKDGGMDVFSEKNRGYFVIFSPTEQFMIQTGIRLFKGLEDYNDLHRFQFDLETEGLFSQRDAIFQIGVRDNKGMEHVIEAENDSVNGITKRESEREMIKTFFKVIDIIQPDIITGYNSENFDWPFLFSRAERLNMPVTDFAITLNRISKIKRRPSTVKFGGDTEKYDQTMMYGYNIIDISHAVRRAMAINSEIKAWGLKYITQYSNIAKPNRVYVPGDKINTIWVDKVNKYAFNDTNGDWYIISDKKPLKSEYKIVKGDYIVQRYLCDDLWETEQIDNLFNQASFLIGKIVPTSFQRSSTMGTAGQWKLIMAAWSYENKLGIPETQKKRDFTGGLARLLELGYAKNVYKLDFAALYPKIQLTHGIFPLLDISGMMEGMLTYIVDTRDKFKFLAGKEKKKYQKLELLLTTDKTLFEEDKIKLKEQITEHKALHNLYDKKQLPLKILANSWFGSYGAPYIFNWGDTDLAEETTCRGRQYLRLMVKFFTEKYGFRALVGDSVTYDTPVYIRYKDGTLDIKPICDLFNPNSESIDLEGLRDYEIKPYEVLTVSGWKSINYVYKHGTTKKIHRITTKDRLVNITEDHSLFQNKIQIKPSTLKQGDSIDVYDNLEKFDTVGDISSDKAWLYGFFLGDGSSNCSSRTQKYKSKKTGERSDWKISNTNLEFLEKLKTILSIEFNINSIIKNHIKSSGVYNLVVHDVKFATLFCDYFYTTYREKKVPNFILNSNNEIKKEFLEGVCASDGYGNTLDTCSDIGMKSQIAMSGIGLLMKNLGIDYKIKTRIDKENFISFSLKNSNRNLSSFTNKTQKTSSQVWKNEIIKNNDKNNFVYDISTEDGTFIGGIGLINLKNTDGFNFAAPDNLDDVKYLAKGTHWKTTDDAGKELVGIYAVLAEFNETHMEGRMGLDLDDICTSTINFARKNYANDINGKIKLVGNSVKSKKMSVYIEDFLGKAIRMLLDGDGHSFIQYYYDYVDKIYNYQIPLVKIASKAKVKLSIPDYNKKATMKNKAGNPMPKQAHMELAIRNNLEVTLGDVLYYINTGTAKSHGDLKTVTDKITKISTVNLNCKIINPKVVEKDFELIKELEILKKAMLVSDNENQESYTTLQNRIDVIDDGLFTDEYNVARYLEAFNKKVKPLLVCFNLEVRNSILLNIVKSKDKLTKKVTEKLKDRKIFTKSECELTSGIPNKTGDQDTYEDLMIMEDKEIKFWTKVDMIPNNILESDWTELKEDYFIRMETLKKEGIEREKEALDDIFKRLEINEILEINEKHQLPIDVLILADILPDDGTLISRKWGEPLCLIFDIFKYENIAIERDEYYKLSGFEKHEDRYQKYLDYVFEREILTGTTVTNIDANQMKMVDNFSILAKKVSDTVLITKPNLIKIVKHSESENDEDDDGSSLVEDSEGDLIRTDDKLLLDDEFDDTTGEIPDGYIIDEIPREIEDEWNF